MGTGMVATVLSDTDKFKTRDSRLRLRVTPSLIGLGKIFLLAPVEGGYKWLWNSRLIVVIVVVVKLEQ